MNHALVMTVALRSVSGPDFSAHQDVQLQVFSLLDWTAEKVLFLSQKLNIPAVLSLAPASRGKA